MKQTDLGIDKTKPDSKKTVSIVITLFDDKHCWTKFCNKHAMNKSGSIEAFIVPMVSGKTTELLRRITVHRQAILLLVVESGTRKFRCLSVECLFVESETYDVICQFCTVKGMVVESEVLKAQIALCAN